MKYESNLIGKRFGRWTVVKKDKITTDSRGRHDFYVCNCDCGKTKSVNKWQLLRGVSKSCGCYRSDFIRNKDLKHGYSRERVYHIYHLIRQRCYNKNHISYKNYGGRGIKMCDEWINNVSSFIFWCYNNGYRQGLSIDRIDVNGNYEPKNCRFATQKQQQRNRRCNRMVIVRGKEYVLADACELFGIKYQNASQIFTKCHGNKKIMSNYFENRLR